MTPLAWVLIVILFVCSVIFLKIAFFPLISEPQPPAIIPCNHEETISTWKKSYSALKETCDNIETLLAEEKITTSNLMKQLFSATNAIPSTPCNHSDLISKNSKMQSELNDLMSNTKILQIYTNDYKKMINNLTAITNNAAASIRKITQERDDSQKLIDDWNKNYKALIDNYKNVTNRCENLEAENQRLKNLIPVVPPVQIENKRYFVGKTFSDIKNPGHYEEKNDRFEKTSDGGIYDKEEKITWVVDLTERRLFNFAEKFAKENNCRLPKMAELISLITEDKTRGFYIHPLFVENLQKEFEAELVVWSSEGSSWFGSHKNCLNFTHLQIFPKSGSNEPQFTFFIKD